MVEAGNLDMDVMKVDTIIGTKTLTSSEIESYVNNDEYQSHYETTCLQKYYILDLLSRMYAELLVTLAVTALFIEILHGPIPLFHLHVHFYVYLLGLSAFIFILGFIGRLIRCNEKNNLKCNSEALKKNVRIHNIAKYFQVGLLVSGLAVFFHSCLRSIAIFLSPETCMNSSSYALFLIHTIFIVLQVAFLQTDVDKLQRIFGRFHRISIMHLIATNTSLWLYSVLWESSTDWQTAVHEKHNLSMPWGQKEINISLHSLEFESRSDNQNYQLPKHVVHVTSNCWWRVPEFDTSEDILSVQLCLQNSSFGMLWEQTSEFLYPIMVLHYIIAIFVLCIIIESKSICYNYCSLPLQSIEIKSVWLNFVLTKGFFLGCILFIASVVVTVQEIIGFIHFVYIMSMLCIVFGLGIFAVLLGLLHVKSIPIGITFLNKSIINSYLQYGIFFIYAFAVCNLLVGCLSEKSYGLLLSFQACLMIFHAVMQYIFLNQITAMPVHSLVNVKFQQGIIFLVLCNASLWVLECFTFWNNPQTDFQIMIYGVIAWSITLRIIIPFLAFYRFHSAVLLLEAWKFMPV